MAGELGAVVESKRKNRQQKVGQSMREHSWQKVGQIQIAIVGFLNPALFQDHHPDYMLLVLAGLLNKQ